MDTDELEALLEGARETPPLEFKREMAWSRDQLARHIIAMSNLRDGGRIVIGVTNDMRREGVSQEIADTYDYDRMLDEIAPLADPFVSFSLHKPVDRTGLRFIIISVSSFAEMPTILRENIRGNDGEMFDRGRILIRSRYGRPRSSIIERADELRELVELSISRRRGRLHEIGLAQEVKQEPYDYNSELAGL